MPVMSPEYSADPFSSPPPAYRGSTGYLDGAYDGPEVPPEHPLSRLSAGLALLALVVVLVTLFMLYTDYHPDGIEDVAPILAIIVGLFALSGIALGHVALTFTNRRDLSGGKFAITGFVLGYISLGGIALILNATVTTLAPGTV